MFFPGKSGFFHGDASFSWMQVFSFLWLIVTLLTLNLPVYEVLIHDSRFPHANADAIFVMDLSLEEAECSIL